MKKLITVSAIANASQGELLCITYEIFLHHIEQAVKETEESRAEYIYKAIEVIRVLVQDLNFESPMAGELLRLYVYMQGALLEYKVTDEKLEHVYQIMEMIYKGFLEVTSQEEQSPPSMANAEAIYAGITYGRSDLNEMVISDKNRGFKA